MMRRPLSRALFLYAVLFSAALSFVFPRNAEAGTADLWRGAAWSGTTGWMLMNCLADSSCAGNDFGVDIDAANKISGWAWSGNVGWMCFGGACAGQGDTPEGSAPYANVDPASYDVHGWGKILSFGPRGWVSLNCSDLPGCTSDYKVKANLVTGIVTGHGWNGNNDGTGVGWIDFSPSSVLGIENNCSDGFDNDSDGLTDCGDQDCLGKSGPATCGQAYVCGAEDAAMTCQDGCDNDGDLVTDCADASSCNGNAAYGCPAAETACTSGNCCENTLDDDFDSFTDCSDTDCFGIGACATTEQFVPTGGCTGADGYACCSDGIDGDVDGALDCSDQDCASYCTGKCQANQNVSCIVDNQCPADENATQMCIPTIFPWLQSLLNDIYGREGVDFAVPPPQTQSNATFCLLKTASGQAVNFVSSLCPQPLLATPVEAPKASKQYNATLGRIDLAGITGGVYGPVTAFSGNQTNAIPSGVLGGRVYVVNGDLTISNVRIFDAGVGTQKGSGLVVVKGDLIIKANVNYASAPVGRVQNLPSAAWLVLKRPDGTGGNVRFDPSVQSFSGIVFAEEEFRSGTNGAVDQPLTVYGPVVAKRFRLERAYADASQASETVIYDARSILNPPPGLEDFPKTLPRFRLGTP